MKDVKRSMNWPNGNALFQTHLLFHIWSCVELVWNFSHKMTLANLKVPFYRTLTLSSNVCKYIEEKLVCNTSRIPGLIAKFPFLSGILLHHITQLPCSNGPLPAFLKYIYQQSLSVEFTQCVLVDSCNRVECHTIHCYVMKSINECVQLNTKSSSKWNVTQKGKRLVASVFNGVGSF